MTRTYKTGIATASQTITTEHALSLSYEDLKLLPWEDEIIESFIQEPGILTKEDILVWIQCTDRKSLFGQDISRFNKETQAYFKKYIRSFLRSAESHKRMNWAPFGGL